MKKNKLKIVLVPVVLLMMFVATHVAVASEVTGYLSTGISSPGLTGIVVAIPVAPANSSGGGSSGGGGGGSSVTLSADTNHDGKVDVLDFVQLMANWGQTGAGNVADFNHDNSVDIGDFVLLMSEWTG